LGHELILTNLYVMVFYQRCSESKREAHSHECNSVCRRVQYAHEHWTCLDEKKLECEISVVMLYHRTTWPYFIMCRSGCLCININWSNVHYAELMMLWEIGSLLFHVGSVKVKMFMNVYCLIVWIIINANKEQLPIYCLLGSVIAV